MMTNRAYYLIGVAVVLFLGLIDSRLAHAQTASACTLDASQFMTSLFGVPSQEVLAQAFAVGFVTPLTGYLVAYTVGLLVNFWNR